MILELEIGYTDRYLDIVAEVLEEGIMVVTKSLSPSSSQPKRSK